MQLNFFALSGGQTKAWAIAKSQYQNKYYISVGYKYKHLIEPSTGTICYKLTVLLSVLGIFMYINISWMFPLYVLHVFFRVFFRFFGNTLQ